jgi:hypothetical protein
MAKSGSGIVLNIRFHFYPLPGRLGNPSATPYSAKALGRSGGFLSNFLRGKVGERWESVRSSAGDLYLGV